MNLAIIGSGIAGLAAARRLCPHTKITLFEADAWLGGHSHTVEVTLEGVTHGVDTGFLVYNLRTYPNLIALFQQLGVATHLSDMSFSVKVENENLEWCGSSLNSLFAQRRNLLRPTFWSMLADILRFNRAATALIKNIPNSSEPTESTESTESTEPAESTISLGEYLKKNRYSVAFCQHYLLPMAGAIWSCSPVQMMDFPIASFARFCHNHGLLQISNRPQWRSVQGGARTYVEKIRAQLMQHGAQIFTQTPVLKVARENQKVQITTAQGQAEFDAVLIATHSNQALDLLGDASTTETQVLGAITYQPNRVLLHTDARVLPRKKRAWAAWNYEATHDAHKNTAQVCVHYLLNKLQQLPFSQPVVVSLNPISEPDNVLMEWHTSHPVLDAAAVAAQAHVPSLQGVRNTWFAGAWCGYGFHEDGLKAGYAAADSILQQLGLSTPAADSAAQEHSQHGAI